MFAGKPKNGEDNAEGIDNVNGDNMMVQNNYIHDICSNGIYAKGGATNVLIENNRIENTYGAGIMVGFDASPEYFDTKVNPKYYENIRGVVRNNLIVHTGWEGIGLYASKDAQVYNNTLVDVANLGLFARSAIYFGITLQDWKSHAGRPANIGPNIHHNVISQPSNIKLPMIEIRFDNNDQLGALSALDGDPVMNNNCYYIAGKSAAFTDNRPGKELKNAGLSVWQTHIKGDNGSLEADPGLDNGYFATNPLCAGMGIIPASSSERPTQKPSQSSSISNFTPVNKYTYGMFNDVNENLWYGFNKQKTIANAYEYGLMKGTGNKFNLTGNMRISEAIAVAARVHSIYTTGADDFVQGSPWYKVYVDYAIANGIVKANDFSDYQKYATRAQMAYIFTSALPAAELQSQNTVNSVPDVNSATPYNSAILTLYKAGVVEGNGAQHLFYPNNNVTRAEAAAIICRLILPDTRISGKTYG